jgi:hypothetical protein
MQRQIGQTGILQKTGAFGSTFLLFMLFIQGVPALALTPIVEVHGIEVTQAVQSMGEKDRSQNNSVPLIANKKTVARVYFTRTSGNSVEITATLVLKRPDGSTKSVRPSKLDSSLKSTLTVTSSTLLAPKRESLRKSLNFLLPDSWTATGQLTLSIAQVKKNGSTVPCSNCGVDSQIQVTFEPAPPFRLALIGLTYKKDGVTHRPRELDFVRIRSWLRRAYPTATVENLQLPNALEEFRFIPYDASEDPSLEKLFTAGEGCLQVTKQLHNLRNVDTGTDSNNPTLPLFHYYGIVSDHLDLMQGCSLGNSTSFPTEGPSPAAGPTGNPSAVHEWRWDKDKSYGDWYAGHELGHTLQRLHSFVCNSQCASDSDHKDCTYLSADYPYQDGQLTKSDTQNEPYFVGLDVGDHGPITTSSGTTISRVPPKVYPGKSSHDVMTSKCDNIWISEHTYKAILQRLREENDVEDTTLPGPPDAIPAESPGKVQVRSGNFLNVIGDVNLTKGTGSISYVNSVSRATGRHATSDRAVVLRVTANGTVNEYPVSVQAYATAGNGSDEKGILDAIIPHVTNIEQLELVLRDVPVATRRKKANLPQVQNIHLEEREAPTASNPSVIKWKTTGADRDSLTYFVQLSNDGKTWRTYAVGLQKNELVLSQAQLKNLKSLYVKVIASDGLNDTAFISEPLSLSGNR